MHALFQSLLWWIAVVNPVPDLASPDYAGFNPCCGGLQSSTQPADRRIVHVHDVSILVVVDCSRQRSTARSSASTEPGFNPCCGGLQSSTDRSALRHQ